MMLMILAFVIGLFVGWFFLPTPAWAKTVMSKIVEWIPALGNHLKKD